jgi:hypothetical protein
VAKKNAQPRDFLIFTFRHTSEWMKSVVSVAAECQTVSGPPGYGHRVVLPASSAPKMDTAGLSVTSVSTAPHSITSHKAVPLIKTLKVKHKPYNAGYLLNGLI